MTTTYAIRRADIADLDAICDLEAACFPRHPWSRGSWFEEMTLAGHTAFVAETEAGLIGGQPRSQPASGLWMQLTRALLALRTTQSWLQRMQGRISCPRPSLTFRGRSGSAIRARVISTASA